jgi:hypothetical protein
MTPRHGAKRGSSIVPSRKALIPSGLSDYAAPDSVAGVAHRLSAVVLLCVHDDGPPQVRVGIAGLQIRPNHDDFVVTDAVGADLDVAEITEVPLGNGGKPVRMTTGVEVTAGS